MLNKIRNLVLGRKYIEQEGAINALRKEVLNSTVVNCEYVKCFENNGKGRCEASMIDINKDGICKEFTEEFVDMQNDFEAEINIVPKFIITEG